METVLKEVAIRAAGFAIGIIIVLILLSLYVKLTKKGGCGCGGGGGNAPQNQQPVATQSQIAGSAFGLPSNWSSTTNG